MSEDEPIRHRSVLTDTQLAPPLPGSVLLTGTRWLLLLEQNLRLCWRFYCVLGLFLALSWLDLFRYLPSFVHFVVLTLFCAAALLALRGTGAGWKLPSLAAAARRVEAANAVQNFPYEALTAEPVYPQQDSAVKTLWQRHQERARQALQKLQLPLPAFSIHGADPYYARLGISALLLLALVTGRGEFGARLERAVTPVASNELHLGPAAKITAWVTPPPYTGQPPILLAENGKIAANKEWSIPAGSKLALRVAEVDEAPLLVTDGAETPFVKSGEQNFTLDMTMPATSLLKITSGWMTLARWPVTYVPDKAPQANWLSPPEADKQDHVELQYRVEDDYGLTQVQAVMSLAVSAVGLPAEPQTFALSGAGQKSLEGKTSLPLGINLWAGMPVNLVLEAADQAGQTGRSGSVSLTLPEHRFTDPLARQLAEMRKKLLLDPNAEWKPTLNQLVVLAQDASRYRGDPRILLGMRSTAVRMYHDRDHENLTPVATTLWQMALHLDTGGVTQAEEKLRQAQQSLEQALAEKADPEKIQQKMQELQQALADYMQSLARNLPPEAQDIPQDLMDEAGQQFAREMMDKIKEIQDLAQTGAHEAAQQKLQELQKMLDQMRNMEPMTEQQQKDLEALKQMRELIEKQEKLQEQTGKAQQQEQQQQAEQRRQEMQQQGQQQPAPKPGEEKKPYASPVPRENYDDEPQPQQQQQTQKPQPQPEQQQQQAQKPQPQDSPPPDRGNETTQAPGQPEGQQQGAAASSPDKNGKPGASGTEKREDLSAAGLAQQQQELREKLGKIANDMAEKEQDPPPQLGTADQGMKSAQQKLGQEEWPQAKSEQNKTLQALKDMAEKMKQQLQKQLTFLPSGGQEGKEGQERNPFSRPDKDKGKGAVDDKVKVPDEQDVQKARKILDELRKRSGEYERPKDERGYIDRLLNKN